MYICVAYRHLIVGGESLGCQKIVNRSAFGASRFVSEVLTPARKSADAKSSVQSTTQPFSEVIVSWLLARRSEMAQVPWYFQSLSPKEKGHRVEGEMHRGLLCVDFSTEPVPSDSEKVGSAVVLDDVTKHVLVRCRRP